MDMKKLAAELVEKVGGKENISNVTHCVTRLRFVVKDASKVDVDGVKGLDGVLDLVISSGQHQVVIGPKVDEAYKETIALVGESSAPAQADKPKEKLTLKGVGKTVLTQGLAEGLGITEAVNSPTFTILQVYEEGRLPLYHFDV